MKLEVAKLIARAAEELGVKNELFENYIPFGRSDSKLLSERGPKPTTAVGLDFPSGNPFGVIIHAARLSMQYDGERGRDDIDASALPPTVDELIEEMSEVRIGAVGFMRLYY